MARFNSEQALQIALQHHQAGRLQEAEQVYRQILAHARGYAPALHHLGVIAFQHGRYDVAVDSIRQAVSLWPNYAEAYSNLGLALRLQGQLDEAIAAYRRAIALRPGYAEALYNLGGALRAREDSDEAIGAYRQAIAVRPNLAEAHSNLGNALTDAGQVDEAIAACRKAIALRPDLAKAHNNLGNALKDKGQLEEAMAAYRQAVALDPDFPEAHSNLGGALQANGQLDEAVTAFRRAMTLDPNLSEPHSNLVFALNYQAAYDPYAIAEEHRRWDRVHAEPLRKFIQPHGNDRSPERRLRIGYVSPDFRQHAVALFVLPLLACHDRERFQVYCYAEVRNPDAVTEHFRANADQWRSTVGLSDEEMAALVRQDQIDILVDLAGHTAGGRLLVFARKPAPVQITWLGYPNSTGLSTMDYRMTDVYADPPGHGDKLYSEQLIRLPGTNWIYPTPDNSPAPDHVAAGGSITFGCFNNFAKVTEPMLLLWGRVLQAVPGSRLLLKSQGSSSPSTRQRVRELFIKWGIDPARLELRGFEAGHDGHLALYNRVDIALDPFPYHGTATTCEALWMGVPVITLAGQTHVSRVGVSLLTNMGLADLIAASEEDYKRIAVNLASDLPRLCGLHSTLRQRMEQSPLLDAMSFARDVEAVYRQVWRKWCVQAPARR